MRKSAAGSPIQVSSDLRLHAPTRGLSQLATPFFSVQAKPSTRRRGVRGLLGTDACLTFKPMHGVHREYISLHPSPSTLVGGCILQQSYSKILSRSLRARCDMNYAVGPNKPSVSIFPDAECLVHPSLRNRYCAMRYGSLKMGEMSFHTLLGYRKIRDLCIGDNLSVEARMQVTTQWITERNFQLSQRAQNAKNGRGSHYESGSQSSQSQRYQPFRNFSKGSLLDEEQPYSKTTTQP